eukprot:CAMPEP_0119189324 /NCGR_PEP_ID=MMETSP1316-20130426/675_1 /TAXON_ID=41880 /ORGANISM="Pycnococcus provasolii, Strain RCC2336" /LENGTH=40 /DNA_ID= /DNA_START= /DNA_END= /DNA_ORIENTATION=
MITPTTATDQCFLALTVCHTHHPPPISNKPATTNSATETA